MPRSGLVNLQQNVPNPFNPQTTIRFELAEAGPVTLAVFDAQGRRVATLARGFYAAGEHAAAWDGRDATGRPVGSGVYLYRLLVQPVSGGQRQVYIRRMLLLR